MKEIGDGTYVIGEQPLNAFLYPDSKNAVFPQRNRNASVDFPSESISRIAGYMGPGNRRKYYPGENVPVLSIMGDGNLTNSRDVEIAEFSTLNSQMDIDSMDLGGDLAEGNKGVSRHMAIPVVKDSLKGVYEASFGRSKKG